MGAVVISKKTLSNFINSHKLTPTLQSEIDIYVVLIGDLSRQAQSVIFDLRKKGLNVAVDYSGSKIEKQIKSAVKKNIKYALFIGADELKSGIYSMKDLNTQQEQKCSIAQITDILNK